MFASLSKLNISCNGGRLTCMRAFVIKTWTSHDWGCHCGSIGSHADGIH